MNDLIFSFQYEIKNLSLMLTPIIKTMATISWYVCKVLGVASFLHVLHVVRHNFVKFHLGHRVKTTLGSNANIIINAQFYMKYC